MLKEPNLRLLPGFLGSAEDFDELIPYLKGNVRALPFIAKENFDATLAALDEQIERPTTLIGYSMGGRLALLFAQKYPHKVDRVIAISAHPGIESEETAEREAWEKEWIDLLARENLESFLEFWYAQPLFAKLRATAHFPKLLAKRRQLDKEELLIAFQSLALSKQPNLWKELSQFPTPLHFIFGEQDKKFKAIHERLISFDIQSTLINTGHAPHIESPEALAKMINQLANSEKTL